MQQKQEESKDESGVDKVTNMLIKEVLESMGRSKDLDNVLNSLQAPCFTKNAGVVVELAAHLVHVWHI